MTEEVKTGKPRGFAAMSPAKRRIIAAMGGRSTQRLGRAHRWTPAEAKLAGAKGGSISRRRPRAARQQDGQGQEGEE